MANKVRLLDRLVGLETEYALRYRAETPSAPRPPRFHLYQAIVAAVARRVPWARARHFKEGVFTAVGGALWFEAERPASGGGLIEGATPECRGPRQLICYQRAQDRLLSESARMAALPGQLTLIKNNRDGLGNVYGAQENYEALIGRGLFLWAWRMGLVLLLPLLALTWLGFVLVVVLMLTYLAVAGLAYVVLRGMVAQPRALAQTLFGSDLVEGRETGCPAPAWMEPVLLWLMRGWTAPLAAALLALSWATAFGRTRRALVPFLVSRTLVGGCGSVGRDGRFYLAEKAPAINCLLGFGGFLFDRPLFTFGHFFKSLCVEVCLAPREYGELFRRRQRLQIGLGDSNMAQTSEYLRVGTTLLMLDAIESGALRAAPRLRHPIRALHRVAADITLQAPLALAGGRQVTALELQYFYLDACRRFVERCEQVPEEAFAILDRWQEALDGLTEYQHTGQIPEALIGTIDWATKKHLLDHAASEVSWESRKKVDIRYHELSVEGYFQLLETCGAATRIVEPEEVERAMRTAPPDSPATTRGRYVREFSTEDGLISVNWKSVVVGRGLGARVVRLHRYGQRSEPTRRRRRMQPLDEQDNRG